MPHLHLYQVAGITGGKLQGDGDRLIEHLETDSRRAGMGENCLFIAITGPRHDGHEHIEELLGRGLRNFIVERELLSLKKDKSVNYIQVKNSIHALQDLAAWYRRQLKMPVIAITGSNGKTVVKEWLAQVLSGADIISRSPKSYNSQVGVPLSVWLLDPEADWSILEAGISMPGEMTRLERIITPEYGIFTNIGPAHQENFNSLEQKILEKLELFQHSKTVYYCYDHEEIRRIIEARERSFSNICWSAKTPECFLFVKKKEKNEKGTSLTLEFMKQTETFVIPFTDEASVENCLHIISFLLHQGKPAGPLKDAIQHLAPVAMRLEQIRGINNSTLINDSYNSDIQSLRIALDFLDMQKQHSLHTLIISDIQQSGQTPEILYGQVADMVRSYHIDQLIVVGRAITKSPALPPGSGKYSSTKELLAHLHELDLSERAILIKGAREFEFEQIVNALAEKKHTTVLEINTNNLIHNLNTFRSLLKPGTRIMVMVKALSYGSGGFEIANLLQHAKVDYLGVAFIDEGIELRKAGISLPVMVMSPMQEGFEKMIEYHLEPEIYNFMGLRYLSKNVISRQLASYPVHIKLDTGMHRLGFMPGEIKQLADELNKLKNIEVRGIFSHLAVSDNPEEDKFTREQIHQFTELADYLSKHTKSNPILHILNSAGIERFPEAHFDMVRLGIGLHGISSTSLDLKAVSTLRTTISQIKNIPATETVGYNRHGVLKRDSVIAIIPIGYADGLNRKFGNGTGSVLVNGKRASFIGDICMDMSMIDITGLPAREGDEVIIFGEENPIRELAKQIDTIPYEILTNVSERVKRVYLNE